MSVQADLFQLPDLSHSVLSHYFTIDIVEISIVSKSVIIKVNRTRSSDTVRYACGFSRNDRARVSSPANRMYTRSAKQIPTSNIVFEI